MASANSKPRRAKLPRGVYRRTTQHGPVYLALVRLKGFKGVSKTFPTADEAIAWAGATKKELGTERKRGPARADLSTLTVGGLVREYLVDPVTMALRSFETYHDRLDWWVLKYGTTRVLDLTVLALREARAALQAGQGLEAPLGPATVNRYLAAIRAAWNWSRSAGLVPADRVWPTKLMLPEPKGRTRYLTDGELTRLLEATRKRGRAEYAMLIVSLATGVRQGELLRLTWADVDFERERARVLLTKNGESRAVHLPAVAIEALKAIRAKGTVVSTKHCFLDNRGEPYVKDTLHHWWNVVRNEAGITDFRWHDLRHSCASFLAQKGATLLEIGSVLGHKSPSVTMRYAHLVQGAPVTGHAALDEKLRGA
jgi:integrase